MPRALSRPVVALALVLGIGGLASCTRDELGPLKVNGPSFIVDPSDHGAWFNIMGCTPHEKATEDMVTDAAVTGVSGASPSDVAISVAWSPPTEYMVADGTPPPEYRQLKTLGHSGGTLDGCSLSIAVALPRPHGETVRVRGLDVTYQAEGHAYVAHADLEIAIRSRHSGRTRA